MDKKEKTPSANFPEGQPDDVFELINKYGTYNIQPTNDSQNEYPAIAQGLSEKLKNERRRDEIGEEPK